MRVCCFFFSIFVWKNWNINWNKKSVVHSGFSGLTLFYDVLLSHDQLNVILLKLIFCEDVSALYKLKYYFLNIDLLKASQTGTKIETKVYSLTPCPLNHWQSGAKALNFAIFVYMLGYPLKTNLGSVFLLSVIWRDGLQRHKMYQYSLSTMINTVGDSPVVTAG